MPSDPIQFEQLPERWNRDQAQRVMESGFRRILAAAKQGKSERVVERVESAEDVTGRLWAFGPWSGRRALP